MKFIYFPSILQKCIENVIFSDSWGCCGFAGDKGLNNPELNKSATRYSNDGIKNINLNTDDLYVGFYVMTDNVWVGEDFLISDAVIVQLDLTLRKIIWRKKLIKN